MRMLKTKYANRDLISLIVTALVCLVSLSNLLLAQSSAQQLSKPSFAQARQAPISNRSRNSSSYSATKSLLPRHASSSSSNDNHSAEPDEADKIVRRKITIIVDDEEPLQQEAKQQPTSNSCEQQRTADKHKLSPHKKTKSSKKKEAKFYLDDSSKLIYIDQTNESGLLIGEILNDAPQQTRPASSSSSGELFDRVHKGRQQQQPNPEGGSSPTNYSIFLISRNPEHIAVLLDIEEIDFEPMINCEYQELKFSIVGEISKQLLDRKNVSDSKHHDDDDDNYEDDADEDDDETSNADDENNNEQASEESSRTLPSQSSESQAAPLPVSEAMAMLLNAPLNMTILNESSESNDFKFIDLMIDFLRRDTCQELAANSSGFDANEQQRQLEEDEKSVGGSGRSGSRGKKPQRKLLDGSQRQQQQKGNATGRNQGNGKDKRRRRQRKKPPARACAEDGKQFKGVMASKLDEFFQWDDFKIVCGKTKQLIIPMRSLKLSVYSDEFSPNSKFIIRYRFLNDPKLLPAHDNGKYYCRNRNTIDLALKCDGFDDCGDASDESVKVCGYPSVRTNEQSPASAHGSSYRQKNDKHNNDGAGKLNSQEQQHQPPQQQQHNGHYQHNRQKLTYVIGDALHCCQSQDWMSIFPQAQSNQMTNLHSLIGDSMMNLFSAGPLFAPTGNERRGTNQATSKRRVKRIVGGGEAQRGAWPGQASLQYELLEPMCHFCAGTLIHPSYVLTAGHCINKEGLSRGIKVVFGAHDLRSQNGSHVQVRYVDDAQIYPGVDVKHLSHDWENDMNNDIALLRLNAPVLVTPHVAPACLPPFNTPLAVNTSCRSIGWGQTHGSGSSNLLKHLSLKVVDSTMCSNELFDKESEQQQPPGKKERVSAGRHSPSIKRRRLVSDFELASLDQYSDLTMVCVNNDMGHGICQGDSGGPLYCDRITSTGEQCTEIYGVASFIIQYATVGAMCAVENLPGIFGEVSSKTEWISSTMKMFEQSYRLKYS